MLIFVTAALFTLFYLCAVPVQFAVSLLVSERIGFGTGLSVFAPRSAEKNAFRRALQEKKRFRRKKSAVRRKLRSAAAMIAAIRFLLRHARVEELEIRGTVAAGDAAVTALLCGSLGELGNALVPFLPRGALRVHLSADFSSSDSRLRFSGMFSVRAGHIIGSALIFAAEIIKRRFCTWTGIR